LLPIPKLFVPKSPNKIRERKGRGRNGMKVKGRKDGSPIQQVGEQSEQGQRALM
jgi:hypothetical protein